MSEHASRISSIPIGVRSQRENERNRWENTLGKGDGLSRDGERKWGEETTVGCKVSK